MRAVFIGTVEFSATLLEVLLEHPDTELVGLITRERSTANADHQDLTPLVRDAGCPVFTGDDIEAMTDWIRARRPDVVFCLGWSRLLPATLLAIPPMGVIGYHPAALPENRGRHPIIWTLALGLSQTASTFFLMDEGADSGDILSQEVVPVADDDDAASLYRRLCEVARKQLVTLIHDLAGKTLCRIPQDHTQASYWRKRTPKDGRIDWRMPAKGIYNLVRALTRPYPGAHFEYEDRDVKVWRARLVHHDQPDIEPGKILATDGGRMTVKCGVAAIDLLEHELRVPPGEGEYLS